MRVQQGYIARNMKEYMAFAKSAEAYGWRWVLGDDLLSNQLRQRMNHELMEKGCIHLIARFSRRGKKQVIYKGNIICSRNEREVVSYSYPFLPPIISGSNNYMIESISEKI